MSVKQHIKRDSQRIRTLRGKLRGGVAKQGVTEDSYRAYLGRTFGVTSTTQLTEAQLRTAFRDYRLQWPFPRSKKKSPAKPPRQPAAAPWAGRYRGRGERGAAQHLTQPQADEIARLEDHLGWTGEPSRLLGFIRRQLSLPESVTKPPEGLMVHEATKVITGLRRQTPGPRAA